VYVVGQWDEVNHEISIAIGSGAVTGRYFSGTPLGSSGAFTVGDGAIRAVARPFNGQVFDVAALQGFASSSEISELMRYAAPGSIDL
jgi:hypothetical protein